MELAPQITKEDVKATKSFSAKQWAYIETLSNPFMSATIPPSQIAQKLGVRTQRLYEWRKMEGFWDEVARKRKEYMKLWITPVYKALYKQAIKGDVRAIELVFKALGEYSEAKQPLLGEGMDQLIVKWKE